MEFIIVDDNVVAFPLVKCTKTDSTNSPSKILTRRAKQLSDGGHWQQPSMTSTTKPCKISDVVETISYEAGKRRLTRCRAQTQDLGQEIHSGFDNHVSGRLSPVYTKPSLETDDSSHSRVHNDSHPACFWEFGTDEKYENVALFLYALHNQSLHRASLLLSKKSALFLWGLVCLYGT